MDTPRKIGFLPVFDEDSRILILGSFPSVKSRQVKFYYGNKQNRFWKVLCGYFREAIPESTLEKKEFLLRRKVALWDMISSCEIDGSADASVRREEVANLYLVLKKAKIEKILLNGTLSYQLFLKHYGDLQIPYQKMPSTSPANPRFDEKIWKEALDEVFRPS